MFFHNWWLAVFLGNWRSIMRLWLFIILLHYLIFAAIFFTHTDAGRKLEGLKGARNFNNPNIKTTFSTCDIVSNPQSYTSYPPHGSLAPNPIQGNGPSHCNYPLFTPQPPLTSFPTPISTPPSFTVHLFSSPSNQLHVPPPSLVQGLRGLVGSLALGPRPENLVHGLIQGSARSVSPPFLLKQGPPFSYIPSPRRYLLPPVVYPSPRVPPYLGPSGPLWCVAKASVPDPILQQGLDYACSSGADCTLIYPGGFCYFPSSTLAHASYAFNSYWQNKKTNDGTCDFEGTAILVAEDPSFDQCKFILL